MEDQSNSKKPTFQPSKLQIICDTLWLAVTSAVLLAVFIINGLANNPEFGFKNSTEDVSDMFFTQVGSEELYRLD